MWLLGTILLLLQCLFVQSLQLDYNVGKQYIYDYETQHINTGTSKDQGGISGSKLSASVVFSVLRRDNDRGLLFEMEVQGAALYETNSPPNYYLSGRSDDMAYALARHHTNFILQDDGKIDTVGFSEEEDIWVANMKKGILSIFQTQLSDEGETYTRSVDGMATRKYTAIETDVHGQCTTNFVHMDSGRKEHTTLKKHRNLSADCKDRRTSLRMRGMSSRVSNRQREEFERQVVATLESEHLIHQSTNTISRVRYTERYVYEPTDIAGSTKFHIESQGYLHLRQVISLHGSGRTRTLVAHPLGSSLAFVYDTENIAQKRMVRGDPFTREVYEEDKSNEIVNDFLFMFVNPKSVDLMPDVVEELKRDDGIYLERLKPQLVNESLPLGLRKLFVVGFINTGTPLAFSIVDELLLSSNHTNKDLIYQILVSLAAIEDPTQYMIQRMNEHSESGLLHQQTLLTIGSLMHHYTLNHGPASFIDDILSVWIFRVQNPSTDLVEASIYLRAIGNAGQTSTLHDLLSIMADFTVSPRIQEGAVKALRRMDMANHINLLWDIYAERSNPENLRSTAAVAIMTFAPSVETAKRFLEYLAWQETSLVVYMNVIEGLKMNAKTSGPILGTLQEMRNLTDVWIDHRLVDVSNHKASNVRERNLIQEVLASKFGKPIDLKFGFCDQNSYELGDAAFGASFSWKVCDQLTARWPFFGIPRLNVEFNNYATMEGHVLGFKIRFLDVGMNIAVRNYRQSLSSTIQNQKTTFTSPACPPELPTACGFGKCAASPLECGLIRLSSGMKELSYLTGQFDKCDRVGADLAPPEQCEDIKNSPTLNWLPVNILNNLYCFCKGTLLFDKDANNNMIDGANNCARASILKKIAELGAGGLADTVQSLLASYNSKIDNINQLDGLLPSEFQNGAAYRAAKKLALIAYQAEIDNVASPIIHAIQNAYESCCCASDPSFMAAWIGITSVSRNDSTWCDFVGAYGQATAVCEDKSGSTLIPSLKQDTFWFIFNDEDYLAKLTDFPLPKDDDDHYHLFPNTPKDPDRRRSVVSAPHEKRYSDIGQAEDYDCFKFDTHKGKENDLHLDPLFVFPLFDYGYDIPIYDGVILKISIKSEVNFGVNFVLDMCLLSFKATAEVIPHVDITVTIGAEVSFFLIRAGIEVHLALLGTDLTLQANFSANMGNWNPQFGLNFAIIQDTTALKVTVTMYVQLRLCPAFCAIFPCVVWCDRKEWPLGGGWSIGSIHNVLWETSDKRVNQKALPPPSQQILDIDEDTIVNTIASATDPDSDPLVFRISAAGDRGKAGFTNANKGAFRYIPAKHYDGPDTFTFRANDAKQDSDEISVTINVYPVADPPRVITVRSTGDQDTWVHLRLFSELIDLDGSESLNMVLCNCDQPDQDDDRIPDLCDNCPAVWNKDQKRTQDKVKGDACVTCYTNLVGWWTFDNTSAQDLTITDETVYLNNGVRNQADYIPGFFGNALSFAAQTGYVSITDGAANSLFISGRISISCFVMFQSYGRQMLMQKRGASPMDGFTLIGSAFATTTGSIAFIAGDGLNSSLTYPTVVAYVGFALNKWYHISVIVAPLQAFIYVDDNDVTSTNSLFSGVYPANGNLFIGGPSAMNTAGSKIDNVLIFNATITAQDVHTLSMQRKLDIACYNQTEVSACCTGESCSPFEFGNATAAKQCPGKVLIGQPCDIDTCKAIPAKRNTMPMDNREEATGHSKRHHLPSGFNQPDISKSVCCGGLQLPPGAKISVGEGTTNYITDFNHINPLDARNLYLHLQNGTFGSICLTVTGVSTEKRPASTPSKRQAFTSRELPVTIFPVNHPPVLTAPASVKVPYGRCVGFNNATSTALIINDPDALDGAITATLFWTSNIVLFVLPLAKCTHDFNPNNTLVMTGRQNEVNKMLASLEVCQTDGNTVGSQASILFVVQDNGNSGKVYVNFVVNKTIQIVVGAQKQLPSASFTKDVHVATMSQFLRVPVSLQSFVSLEKYGARFVGAGSLYVAFKFDYGKVKVDNLPGIIWISGYPSDAQIFQCDLPADCIATLATVQINVSSLAVNACDLKIGSPFTVKVAEYADTLLNRSPAISHTAWIQTKSKANLLGSSSLDNFTLRIDTPTAIQFIFEEDRTPLSIQINGSFPALPKPNDTVCAARLLSDEFSSLWVEVSLQVPVGDLMLNTSSPIFFFDNTTKTPRKYMRFAGAAYDVNNALKGLLYYAPMVYSSSSAFFVNITAKAHGLVVTEKLYLWPSPKNEYPTAISAGYIFPSEGFDYPLDFLAIRDYDIENRPAGYFDVLVRANLLTQWAPISIINYSPYLQVYGPDSNNVTLIGNLSHVNLALKSAVYRPPMDQGGPDQLTFTVSDGGAYGYGAIYSDTSITIIEVLRTAQVPYLTYLGNSCFEDEICNLWVIAIPGSPIEKLVLDVVVPDYVTLSNGTFDGEKWSLLPKELIGLHFLFAEDYNGEFLVQLTLIEREPANGDTKQVSYNITWNVYPSNDSPVLTGPPQIYVWEDVPALINNPFGIELSDVDFPNGTGGHFFVRIICSHCTLQLKSPGQTTVGGNNTNVLYFEGPLELINQDLLEVVYLGVKDYQGSDNLNVMTTDYGNVGLYPYNTSKISFINIPVIVQNTNDPPRIASEPALSAERYFCQVNLVNTTCPVAVYVNEGSSTGVFGFTAADIDPSDVITVSISAKSGYIKLFTTQGLTLQDFDASSTSAKDRISIIASGSIQDINAALSFFKYEPFEHKNHLNNRDYYDLLVITVRDKSAFDTRGYLIDVAPVNDCPLVALSSVPEAPLTTLTHDTKVVAFGIYIFDDMDELPVHYATITLEVVPAIAGNLSLSNTAGVQFISGDGYLDSKMIFTGNAHDLKTVLAAPWMWAANASVPLNSSAYDGIQFYPSKDFVGQFTIFFTVNDNGFAGKGAACATTVNATMKIVADTDFCTPFCGTCCVRSQCFPKMSYDKCASLSGIFTAADSCSASSCSNSTEYGACCLKGVVQYSQVPGFGGPFYAANLANTTCVDLSHDSAGYNAFACAQIGGNYILGARCQNKTRCPCADKYAACCSPGGICANVLDSQAEQRACAAKDGRYNPGQLCRQTGTQLSCPATGSCCVNATCVDQMGSVECTRMGGAYSAVRCSLNRSCARGSCCYTPVRSTPTCANQVPEDRCSSLNGTFTNGGVCSASTCQTCTPLCSNKRCGDDGCGGVCGVCSNSTLCSNKTFTCDTCAPNCKGKQCGADGCGGTCGSCTSGNVCSANYTCNACTRSCSGKTCGSDGCGGTCGTCTQDGYSCSNTSKCVCTPDCAGKRCGPDGCGGFCEKNACTTAGYACITGSCVKCTKNCNGKRCGSDGCGGTCGSCASPLVCMNDTLCGQLESNCTRVA